MTNAEFEKTQKEKLADIEDKKKHIAELEQ